MEKIAIFLVRNKKQLFFVTCALVILIPWFVSFPTFSGKLNGFDIGESSFYRTALSVDSFFGTKNKVHLLVTPQNVHRTQVFRGVRGLMKEISMVSPGSKIISPYTFYRSMPGQFTGRDVSIGGFLKQAQHVPMLRDLVAKDAGSFLVVVELQGGDRTVIRKLDSLLERDHVGFVSVKPLSIFHIENNIEKYIRKDIVTLSLAILFFFFIYYLYVFRKVSAIIYTSLVVGVSVFISLFFFSLFNYHITLISVLVIPVVLILSLSDSLHLMTGYIYYNEVPDKNERLQKVVRQYLVPSFFSSATTAAAFFSFYFFNGSEYIREFGLVTGLSLLTEFFVSFLTAPYILYLINVTRMREKKILSISAFFENKRKFFAVGFLSALVISFFLVPRLQFKTNSELFFPIGSQIKNTHDQFLAQFYSQLNLNVLLSGPESSPAEVGQNLTGKPDILRNYTAALTKELRQQKDVLSVTAVTDTFYFISDYGMTLNIYDVAGEKNPYYVPSKHLYRVEARFRNAETALSFCKNELPGILSNKLPGVKAEYTSPALVMDEVNKSVSSSLVNSLLTSGAAIFLFILILTRSISLSLLSLIPNLVPLALVVIIYVFAGMQINILTAITAVVSLGLLDDDTIHILYRRLRLNEPLEELSLSIFSAAFLLIAGFGLFCISSFQPTRVFGWVSALVFFFGVVCELTLMQWLIEKWKAATHRSK